jgi:hypothetical protein
MTANLVSICRGRVLELHHSEIVPLTGAELADVAPDHAAMTAAIAKCEQVDEIKSIADKATALRAYYALSGNKENERIASRIRLRAERRLGDLIRVEREAGVLAKRGGNGSNQHSANVATGDISTLSDIGISRDRSARAQKLASVPDDRFETALLAPKPSSRSIAALAPRKASCRKLDAQVKRTVRTICQFSHAISRSSFVDPNDFKSICHDAKLREAIEKKHIPRIIDYLSRLAS